MTSPFARVHDALDARGCGPRKSGAEFKARCPAHDDRNPSLGFRETDDGHVLVKCHVGCSTENVVSALGLTMADLSPERSEKPRIVAVYQYVDEHGARVYEKVRYQPKDFRLRRSESQWGLGDVRRVLYRLPAVLEAIRTGSTIYVTEGEKDADAGAKLGLVCTTDDAGAWKAGQSPKWREEHTATLAKAKQVVIVADKDDPGRARAHYIRKQLAPLVPDVRVMEMPGEGVKDLADWVGAGGTREQLEALVQAAASRVPGEDDGDEGHAEQTEEDARGSVWSRDPLTVQDLVTPPPPRLHLLEHVDSVGGSYGILPRGIAAILSAAGDTGKSQLLISLALSLATGRPWLGFRVASTGQVLLVLAEEDREEAVRRIYNNARAMGLDDGELAEAVRRIHLFAMAGKCVSLVRVSLPDDPGLPFTTVALSLKQYLDENAGTEGWAALIFDPLSRISGPDTEVDNSAATRFVQVLEALGQVKGRPVVLCSSHTSQAARTAEASGDRTDAARTTVTRGVTGLTDAVRWVATIEPFARIEGAPEISVLRVTKSNYARKPGETFMVAQPEFLGARRPATEADLAAHEAAKSGAVASKRVQQVVSEREAHRARVLELVSDPAFRASTARLKAQLGKRSDYVQDLLEELEEEGRIARFGSGPSARWTLAATSPATSPVSLPDLSHLSRATSPATSPPPPYVVGAGGGGVVGRERYDTDTPPEAP